MIDFYWYPKCSTCRKAKQWLDENKVDYHLIDLIQETPKADLIEKWLTESNQPMTYFFNTHGDKYRELNLKDELPTMSISRASHLLASDGMLMKRPILTDGTTVTTGFKEAIFKEVWLNK
ncbi:arsenate reductase family protein [Dellaglioa sp. BT-FLS60]